MIENTETPYNPNVCVVFVLFIICQFNHALSFSHVHLLIYIVLLYFRLLLFFLLFAKLFTLVNFLLHLMFVIMNETRVNVSSCRVSWDVLLWSSVIITLPVVCILIR